MRPTKQAVAKALIGMFLAILVPNIALGADSMFTPLFPNECKCLNQTVQSAPGATAPAVTETVTTAPDYGCILQTIQNMVNAAIQLGVILSVVWIAWGGFAMMISGGSAEARSQAKTRLLNVVVGMSVILISWLIVDFVMKVVYNPAVAFEGNTFGPWNSILAGTGKDLCIVARTPIPITTSVAGLLFDIAKPGVDTTTAGNSGTGSCNPSLVQQAGVSAGAQTTGAQANFLACIAEPESTCGARMENYNWGKGSSAYGPFQILLKDHAEKFEKQACYTAAGVSGPLNCASGFRNGNPIPGKESTVETCKLAAANLACSTAVATQILGPQSNGYTAWTGNSDSKPKHQECKAQLGK